MSAHLQVYRPSHPRASKSGCVYEHIVIVETALGKYLPDGAEVHHIDENKRNNRNANLVACQDAAYHKLLHARARIVRAGGNPDSHALCSTCRQVKTRSQFNRASGNKGLGLQTQCRDCSHRYTKTYQRRQATA